MAQLVDIPQELGRFVQSGNEYLLDVAVHQPRLQLGGEPLRRLIVLPVARKRLVDLSRRRRASVACADRGSGARRP